MASLDRSTHTFSPLHTQTPTRDVRDALRRGDISSRELVELSLDLISGEPALGAFVSVQAELALREAEQADELLQSANPFEASRLPPLLGVPTAHKDLVQVAGAVTTHGSHAVPHLVAQGDDPVAAAVRSAGAISLGKTQVPEFGIAAYSENLVAAPARNHGDMRRTPGGSSGGTASAIAAGFISGAIASDGGGSIRIPAAACGLVGLKPSRGSFAGDAARSSRSEFGTPALGVSGPLASSVTDAALWFDALRGDHTESTLSAVHRSAEIAGLRIGVSTVSPFAEWVDVRFAPAVLEALRFAADTLSQRHRVEDASLRYRGDYPDAFTRVWSQPLARFTETPAAFDQLGTLSRWFAHSAHQRTTDQHRADAALLQECALDAAAQWAAYDVILTPTIAFLPPQIDAFTALDAESDYRLQCQWAPITSLVNVVGSPAVSVPVARTAGGWPVSVQLIGQPGAEAQLLQLAEHLTEPATPRILTAEYE